MDKFVQLPLEDKQAFFIAAADKIGLSPRIVEKDLWVCWVLKKLFELDGISQHLIFKGGTSLSKVYGIIERFSEDVNVSVDRAYLGFGEENDPEKLESRKKKEKAIEDLSEACKKFVNGPVVAKNSFQTQNQHLSWFTMIFAV